jgi:hypothetical protein
MAMYDKILLKDGTVLVTGGYDANLNILPTAELFQ